MALSGTLGRFFRKLRTKKRHVEMQIVKRSEHAAAFGGLLDAMAKAGEKMSNDGVWEVFERGRQTEKELRGQVRHTSYAHEMVDMDAADLCHRVSSKREALFMLWEAVRQQKPRWCVEMGSAFGVASMCMGSALRANGSGQFDGIEFEAWRAEVADRNVKRYLPTGAVHAGRIEDVFPKLAAEKGAVDFAFVDAVHKYDETLGYHTLLARSAADGCIVLYDDINWSEHMKRFWADVVKLDVITDAALFDDRWGVVRHRAG